VRILGWLQRLSQFAPPRNWKSGKIGWGKLCDLGSPDPLKNISVPKNRCAEPVAPMTALDGQRSLRGRLTTRYMAISIGRPVLMTLKIVWPIIGTTTLPDLSRMAVSTMAITVVQIRDSEL
jgi:hypothetical protein